MERDLLAELSNAVACYLNAMAATADCIDQASPHVGGPYRQRIKQLRARIAFEAGRQAIQEGNEAFLAELKDYAAVAGGHHYRHSLALEREILALEDIIETLAYRQEVHSSRLRQLSADMEQAAYPVGGPQLADVVRSQAVELRTCVEHMEQEAAAMLARMHRQMSALEERLAGAESTDPATGLINRREMDRQIEAHTLHGKEHNLLLFEMDGPLSDQVMRQAAEKLSAHFRHRDRVGRWSTKEFAVLFVGDRKAAQARAQRMIAELTGRYTLDNGEHVQVRVEARLLEPRSEPVFVSDAVAGAPARPLPASVLY
jgi:GGDEF domain-containing protein